MSCTDGKTGSLAWHRLFRLEISALGASMGLCTSICASEASASGISCDAKLLIWATFDTGVALLAAAWDEDTEERQTSPGLVDSYVRCAEGTLSSWLHINCPWGLLCGAADGRVLLFRPKLEASGSKLSIRCKAILNSSSKGGSVVSSLAADARLPILVSGHADGSVKIWDSTSWQCLRTIRYSGEGAVTAVAVLACAPFRGLAIATAREPHLRMAWFGRVPALISGRGHGTKNAAADAKTKRHLENPGKASTSADWRGVVPNTRKADSGYSAAEYRHRGVQRKERRDLAARVKVAGSGVGAVGSSGGRSAPLFQSADESSLPGLFAGRAPAPAAEGGGQDRWWETEEYDEDYEYDDYYDEYDHD
eukprot:TRINITY_DN100455_c0_g1_i1.p1 TRINITY_DN100455_c0_g1~~TRINITY_DN100455_c0_g1_i1.p1  ORF type:complete len:365 (-),score=73.25 TRINITY_DN100455_c0_g1_i1:42-1136(-)